MGERPVKNIARPVRAFRVRDRNDAIEESPRKPHRLRRGALASAAALGAALAVAGGTWWLSDSGALPISTPPVPSLSAVALRAGGEIAPRLSIIVMPFANLGGDPQQEYFVDGITESLTTDLSRALPGGRRSAAGQRPPDRCANRHRAMGRAVRLQPDGRARGSGPNRRPPVSRRRIADGRNRGGTRPAGSVRHFVGCRFRDARPGCCKSPGFARDHDRCARPLPAGPRRRP